MPLFLSLTPFCPYVTPHSPYIYLALLFHFADLELVHVAVRADRRDEQPVGGGERPDERSLRKNTSGEIWEEWECDVWGERAAA